MISQWNDLRNSESPICLDIDVLQQTACLVVSPGWWLCFPLWLHAGGLDFRLYDGSDLGTYLLVGWWGPGALAVCRAHWGLPVGLLLLRYSV